ncbi:hypothetical protein Mp_4g03200 [Marchantia polymorpha subsp. ruderalis]|uniref:Uncharacterized protein n=2 Tax=Marchantia polymorpha TaxID=3197 RepID=A0AAF6B5S7_MARPO|nr:hypothetical protein MARPO_0172s0003 [Marchantia polymorpha]PTQ28134.1 hypothetical protein MARPO_0172s0006 [Marchantia polymorpha]BBN07360.1 hypothetical protein Mp_4g03190 [Marchantia polymorpha subsp. ruderalis]BBN07361.1 hypothetical protein Mp_4g03200 [Marchantia polymorpha subsp. ruderalis]|eukprot:PTQ28131.1 hypothetical protein MARPO_0172s0003 [Marchantia polymorpha]
MFPSRDSGTEDQVHEDREGQVDVALPGERSRSQITKSTKSSSLTRFARNTTKFSTSTIECLVSPICGPTFTSIKNPDYDLCAFCHDDKLQSDSIRSGDFCSREKPDASAVYHLNIICCVHCSATPIKGPAFKRRRDPNKTLCLICYYHVLEDKKRFFLRIEPPRQADKGPGPN